ncbi:unnamed protein product [Lupinus luteus]|uniref:Uncharacterized protein n=1 Tax=Lupinus luteus TaxID=3873 RepID=A0AAV1Y9W2_LUPLU
MPSGPKKRKAAKKKKQNENNINNLQGNDELKSQDEIGSDGGEVSSPRDHDHGNDHQNPFNEGSEEAEKRDLPASQPIASDAKSTEEIPSDTQIDKILGQKEDSVVLIEGDMKSEESDVSFEHIETAKESCYGNENGGGTSKDESVTNNPKDEDYNIIGEAIVCHELVKSIDSPSSDVTSIAENAPVEETGNSAVESSVTSKEDSVVLVEGDMKSEESSESKDVNFEHIETAKESCYGNENGSGTSNDESITKNNPKDEDYNSIEEAIVCHELVKSIDSPPSDVTSIAENAPVEETGNSVAESSVYSVKAVASLSVAENDDNGSVLVENTVVPSVGVTDLAMKINEDRVYPLIDENARTSNLKEPKPKESDSKVITSLSASPITKSFNGAEHIKESETPECSQNQPLVASAPRIVQKTSWLSCCGLYEVVSGSDR